MLMKTKEKDSAGGNKKESLAPEGRSGLEDIVHKDDKNAG
jgi:hypothetical protein